MTDRPPETTATDRPLVAVIALVLLLYAGAAVLGVPQRGTELTNGSAHETAASHNAADLAVVDQPRAATEPPTPPPFWTVIPFVLLLAAIAVLPLSHRTAHWWESNLHRFYVAAGLGILTLAYYALLHPHAVERHFLGRAVIDRGGGAVSWELPWAVLQNAIFNEYAPFIVLLFSLYTISGGIRIEGDLPAHPLTNTAFMGVGAVLASFIGTTGAAMLLIRPLLETNSERRHVRHTVVFFIFVVCNCGGCLLPLGDPPLFLGYLQGVDFFWTLSLWKEWLLVNVALLAIYYVWDHYFAYRHETKPDIVLDELRVRRMRFSGLWPNVALLLGVVVAVALLDPSKPLPFTEWHPWLYLREAVLLALVAFSLSLGPRAVRQANRFNYAAIVEVAALFLGIFVCMQPALQILEVKGAELGLREPWQFFWSTGMLSSILDNAPTYLVFFKAAQSLHASGAETMAGVATHILAAISLGAVFMGANTYIGNGPNFMVKSIAESSGVKMPTFFGYMVYSGCILLPLFVLVTFLL